MKLNTSLGLRGVLFGALSIAALAMWAPHAAEKAALLATARPAVTGSVISKADPVIGFNHNATMAVVLTKLQATSQALGVKLPGLPVVTSPAFEQQTAAAQVELLNAAHSMQWVFLIVESALVALFVFSIGLAFRRGVFSASGWLMGSYALGLFVASGIFAAHIAGGIRAAMPSQTGFVLLHIAGIVAAGKLAEGTGNLQSMQVVKRASKAA